MTPERESARLQALDRLHVLDTPPDDSLDDIAELASQICGTPIALVSLVAGNRQWFKAKVGIETAQTPRDLAFCAYAIDQQDISQLFEVCDATTDPRFLNNSLVTGDPHIRFYAGAPLVTSDGHPIGALCVIDRKPRTLTPAQSRSLRVLARSVIAHLELRQRADELSAALGIAESASAQATEAKVLAESASLAKGEFLAHMSHEFRTPLNGISGATALLRMTELNDEQARFVRAIKSSSDTLLALVGDVLDFSKIEARQLELETVEFNLAAVIDDVIAAIGPSAAAKNLEIRCVLATAIPQTLLGDPRRFSQILSNLLNNALKFSNHGEVTLNAAVISSEPASATIKFEVSDTGIGIAANRIDRLFKSFSQVDSSTTRKYGGTGLGLVICKRLVELMGGTIGVESEEGRGSTFWFTIQFICPERVGMPKSFNGTINASDENSSSQQPVEAAHPGPPGGIRVLLAEDNEVNQFVAGELLRRSGCQVEIARDGREAVAAAESGRFDLIVMDCQMPTMDGFEATAAIRANEALGAIAHRRRTPIIALTANAVAGDSQRCLAAGMDGYLSKPLDPALLFAEIAKVANHQSDIKSVESRDPPDPNPKRVDLFEVAIDHDELLRRCGEDRGLVAALLELFCNQLDASRSRLIAAAAAADFTALAGEAHSLNGAALAVSARSLAAHCERVECLARQSINCGFKSLSPDLKAAVDLCMTASGGISPAWA